MSLPNQHCRRVKRPALGVGIRFACKKSLLRSCEDCDAPPQLLCDMDRDFSDRLRERAAPCYERTVRSGWHIVGTLSNSFELTRDSRDAGHTSDRGAR